MCHNIALEIVCFISAAIIAAHAWLCFVQVAFNVLPGCYTIKCFHKRVYCYMPVSAPANWN